eukprot:SAG31_NODE_1735_length_7410_cov_2.762960_1_plen_259_part_00
MTPYLHLRPQLGAQGRCGRLRRSPRRQLPLQHTLIARSKFRRSHAENPYLIRSKFRRLHPENPYLIRSKFRRSHAENPYLMPSCGMPRCRWSKRVIYKRVPTTAVSAAVWPRCASAPKSAPAVHTHTAHQSHRHRLQTAVVTLCIYTTICAIYQCINISIYQRINVSTYQHINISTYQHINISTYQHINISTYQYINISTYQHINISTYQHINISTYHSAPVCCGVPASARSASARRTASSLRIPDTAAAVCNNNNMQ